MNLRQAAETALKHIETQRDWPNYEETKVVVDALRVALAEAEEPVAWAYVNSDGECRQIAYGRFSGNDDSCITHLYTHPPRREPLTGEQIASVQREIASSSAVGADLTRGECWIIVRIIERAHGIGGDE